MSDKKRLNLEISAELYADIERLAEEHGCSKGTVFRVALALYKVCDEAKKSGLHIGLARDREKLDTVLVGII